MNTRSLSQVLCRIGLLLLALYIAVVCFDVLPLKLLQPDWILNFAYTLSSFVTIPLIGMALVHIAALLAPAKRAKLQLRIARLAAGMALLFLLVQPMLAFAVWKNAVDLTKNNRQQSGIIRAKAKELRKAVASAGSFEQLQVSMLRLQGPQIPEQARSMGLDGVKKQALTLIDQAEKAISFRLPDPNSPAFFDVYKRVARAAITSFLGMIGFAILAWNPISDRNIILVFLSSIGLFGFKPAKLGEALKKEIDKRKEIDGVKAAKKLALQHEQRMRKKEASTKRDLKRRLADTRKWNDQVRQRMLEEEEKRDRS